MKHVDVSVKIIVGARKIIAGILPHVFVKIASVLKILLILQWSMWWNYICYGFVSTKKTITIATNVMSTASINCHSKKECYILYTVLLAIILLLITTIICYHYAEQKGTV